MVTNHPLIEGLSLSPDQLKVVGFLAEETKRMIITAFSEQRTSVQSLNLIQEIYRVTDEMMAGSSMGKSMLPCKKGCSWCCSLRVKVTPLEILCIAGYLQSHLNTELLELKAGMRVAMQEDGSGLAEKWLSGEPAFAQAELPDEKIIEQFHRTLVRELGKNLFPVQ